MKLLLKLLTNFFFIPFIIFAAIIAILKLIYSLTFVFAYNKGNDWYDYLLRKVEEYIDWVYN